MTEAGGRTPRRPGGRRFKIVIGAAVAVVVIWTGLWFAAASVFERQLDKALASADRSGTTLACESRTIEGFPFRLELRCGGGSRIATRDVDATLGGLTGVALVYDPRRVIVEAGSPASLTRPFPATAEWQVAHASAAFTGSGAREVRVEVEEVTMTSPAMPRDASADLVGLYLRPSPDDPAALDVGLKADGVKVIADAVPLDARGRVLVENAAGVLSGEPDAIGRALRADGLPIVIDQLLVQAGEAVMSVGGAVTVRPDGLLDGSLDVALALPGGTLPDLGILDPKTAAAVAGVLKNVLAFAPETTIGDTPARKLTLTIRSGRVSAGFVPLGRIPPVLVVAGG